MTETTPITFLCIASYFKGMEFIHQCKRLGCRVVLITKEKVRFAALHRYKQPPMEVAHGGGIFASCTLPRSAPERPILRSLNEKVITQFGLLHGVSHTGFINGADDIDRKLHPTFSDRLPCLATPCGSTQRLNPNH